MLDAGGNAIDAAVATALALATHEPWNSGLGGIGFALVHRAGQKRAEVVDFGPRAPAATDPATYKLTGRMTTDLFAWPEVEGDINIHGPLSVAIPASVAGYDYMHRQWGRLPLAEVIAPAIALAKRGLPQDWYTALKVVTSALGDAALSAHRRGLPAERTAAGAALSGQARLLPPGQSAATRWSASAAPVCATSTRATSPPRSPPMPRRSAACCRSTTCATARCAPGRRRRSAGAAARCNSPAA